MGKEFIFAISVPLTEFTGSSDLSSRPSLVRIKMVPSMGVEVLSALLLHRIIGTRFRTLEKKGVEERDGAFLLLVTED